MIIIQPGGGLSNYLRVVFSYNEYAKSINSKLLVIWKVTESCNGYFLDYFESVENIEFIKFNNKNYDNIIITCNSHEDFRSNFLLLKPLPYLKYKILGMISLLNNYIAIHVRRTDHVSLALKFNKFTTDQDFINFIKANKKNNLLYVATDNKKTYDFFYDKYKNKMIFKYHEVIKINYYNKRARHTSLEDSIIDMFVCVHAKKFLGSGYSSFSGIIDIMRNINYNLKC